MRNVESVVRVPSLDLSWLPNSITKGLVIPQIRYVTGDNCGGAYYPIQDHDNDWGNLKKRPMIEIDCNENTQSTIAHEYRHHYQTYHIGNLVNVRWCIPNGKTYKQAIIDYFSYSWSEMDALLFECRVASSDVNNEWFEWVQQWKA